MRCIEEVQVVGCLALAGVLAQDGEKSSGLTAQDLLYVRTSSSVADSKFSSSDFLFNLQRQGTQIRVSSSIGTFIGSFLISISTGNDERPQTLILEFGSSNLTVHKTQTTQVTSKLPP